MAVEYNLYIDQGSDFTSSINVKGQDLSTAIITGQMRRSYTASDYYEFTIIPVDLLNGKFSISLSGLTSTNIKSGRYVYDVSYQLGNVGSRVIEGIATINPMVTRNSGIPLNNESVVNASEILDENFVTMGTTLIQMQNAILRLNP